MRQPAWLRAMATLISWLFHPVFVPVYIVLFMVYVHPYLFTGTDAQDKIRVTAMAVLMFTFFPVVTVGLLKALDFIQSVYLRTQKDRIIPLVASGVFYFWITYVWWNSYKVKGNLYIPPEAVQLALATFIASWVALMANIRMKISLHAIAMGVMLAFMFSLAFSQTLNFGLWLSVAILIAGLVCTARLIISDHKPAEVYWGLAAGAVSMLVAEFAGKTFS